METLQCYNCCKDIPIDDFKIDTRDASICTKCYNNFIKEKVDWFFEHEGITNLSQIQDDDGYCEPYFSSSSCDCCNSSLGGNRYNCNGYNPINKEIYEYQICMECIFYCETGEFCG